MGATEQRPLSLTGAAAPISTSLHFVRVEKSLTELAAEADDAKTALIERGIDPDKPWPSGYLAEADLKAIIDYENAAAQLADAIRG